MKKKIQLDNKILEILNAFKKHPQQSYNEVISNLISDLNDALTNNILFNALMDHLPSSVYFKDREGRHLKVCKATQKDYNEIYCKRVGLEPQDMIGKTDEELYKPELAKRTFRDDLYVIKSKNAIINREEHTPTDGRYFSTTKAPIFNKKGYVTGLVGITYDITALKVTEKELKKSTKKLRNLSESLMVINTILRHDIFNYLTQVIGFLDLYKMEKDEFYLERVYNPVQRAVSVINKLGELEKLIIQEEPLKPYNLREISENVLMNLSSPTIKFDIVGQGLVLADQALYSVVENLVRNAII
ncbi:MAG: PAS domain-containing protein, partial [Candidatus Hodarchaeota archaeon]